VSEQLLFVLKLCLLALLYLFFFRVLRAVWAELRAPVEGRAPVAAAPRAGAPVGLPAEPARREERKPRREKPLQLVVLEPGDQRGRAFTLGNEVTLGRAAGCQVTLDDNYVSQLHARVFSRDGRYLVEDLGSTNGTYLNRQKVSGPMSIDPGDRLQIGNTVLELR
jgi:pSer/pThr/pTyr-binding forkhead associated (FHA) protein